jgi:4-aminobutyrate aminotransferase
VIAPSFATSARLPTSSPRDGTGWDVDGNRFLDFAAGIAVCSTGTLPGGRAGKERRDEFLHISSDYGTSATRLGERINELDPCEPVQC